MMLAGCSSSSSLVDGGAPDAPVAFDARPSTIDAPPPIDARPPDASTASSAVCVDGWCWAEPELIRATAAQGFASGAVWAAGEHDVAFNWNGQAWSVLDTGADIGLRGVVRGLWGASPVDVWLCGPGLRRFNAGAWTQHGDATCWAIDGRAADDVWAAAGSRLLHWDGAVWQDRGALDVAADPAALHVVSSTEIYALTGVYAASPRLHRWNGSMWTTVDAAVRALPVVWTAPTTFIGVAADGDVWRWEGGAWDRLHDASLEGIATRWGRAANDLDVLTGGGDIAIRRWHFDGASWSERPAPPFTGRAAVAGDVVALFGPGGGRARWDGNVWIVDHPAGVEMSCSVRGAGVSGTSDADVWRVSSDRHATRLVAGVATRHEVVSGGPEVRLEGVVARAANDVYAVGGIDNGNEILEHWDPVVFHWNGQTWSRETIPAAGFSGEPLRGAFAIGDEVWAYGTSLGRVYSIHRVGSGAWQRFDVDADGDADLGPSAGPWLADEGTVWQRGATATWTAVEAPPSEAIDVVEQTAGRVWAKSDAALMLWDGARWRSVSLPSTVWPADPLVVGDDELLVLRQAPIDVAPALRFPATSLIPDTLPQPFADPCDTWQSPTGTAWVVTREGLIYRPAR